MTAREPRSDHPDDVALQQLIDGDQAADAGLRAHVAACDRCTERLTGLEATRRVLQGLSTNEQRPQHDLAQRVVGRLRLRRSAIGNMNEVFAAVRALFRGFTEFFGAPPPPRSAMRPQSHEEGPLNG